MNWKNKDSAVMAARCNEISEDPKADADIAELARELKHQWRLLEMRGQPWDRKENEQLNAEKQAHALRMAEFLNRYFPLR